MRLCVSILLLLTIIVNSESLTIPRSWGVNIHYTKGRPGESLQLSQAYRIVRMDFIWENVEKVQNQYDFSAYDQLWNELKNLPDPVACYWILDYGNRLYDNGSPPHTEQAIQAFVNFAVASLKHFAGRGIIWEMWNEPNGVFWPPAPNVTAYSILANAVGKAIRATPATVNEIYVGPAASGVDINYLEEAFQQGVLEYFDAVSVHPYRGDGPESVLPEYNNVKNLILKYGPKGKNIPILSGEWGWSTCLPPCTPGWPVVISEDVQARYLARQWLINTLADVPISIYYDFQNDGPDATAREDNFGTVNNQYYNQTVPHIPKPAFNAAVVLQKIIGKLKFLKRVDTSVSDDFVLSFSPLNSNNDVVYAVWRKNATTVIFHPITAGCFTVVNIYGNTVTANLCTDLNGNLSLLGSDIPLYLNRKTMDYTGIP